MPIQEKKEVVLTRVPPGDRWAQPGYEGDKIYESLTDALNGIYDKTGCTNYYIEARAGTVWMVISEEVPVAPPPPPKKFSIYGDS